MCGLSSSLHPLHSSSPRSSPFAAHLPLSPFAHHRHQIASKKLSPRVGHRLHDDVEAELLALLADDRRELVDAELLRELVEHAELALGRGVVDRDLDAADCLPLPLCLV